MKAIIAISLIVIFMHFALAKVIRFLIPGIDSDLMNYLIK